MLAGRHNVTVQMQPLQSSERSEHSIARLSFATVCYAAGASLGGRRDLAQEPLDVVAVGERRGQAIGWSGHGHKNAVSAMTVGATRDSRGEGGPITIRGATRTSAAKSPSGSESAESAAPVDAPQRGDPRNLDTLQRRSVRAGRCRASGTTTSSGLILASQSFGPERHLSIIACSFSTGKSASRIRLKRAPWMPPIRLVEPSFHVHVMTMNCGTYGGRSFLR